MLRGVGRARAIPGGWVIRQPDLPDVWHLNRVHLAGAQTDLDADGLVALADSELAGCAHRRVTLDDAVRADALWPALEPRGWRRDRTVVMALDAGARAGRLDGRVSELDDPGLRGIQRRATRGDAGIVAISASLPDRLAESQARLRAQTPWRAFGAAARAGGAVASSATVYLDPDVGGARVAFVDEVATLREHRERGLGDAVVEAAVAAAREWGADLVALFADADDWPQLWYSRKGFVEVGRQVTLHLTV